MPPNHLNPYEAPLTEICDDTEKRSSTEIPGISRSVFGWLFVIFCLLQFLPGYHYMHFGWNGKPATIPVGFCNLGAIMNTLDAVEHLDRENGRNHFLQVFSLGRFLQMLALGAYFILNIRMLRRRLTLSSTTLIVLIILINGSWYYLLHYEKPSPNEYNKFGLYLQTILFSVTSFLAWSRLRYEKRDSASLA